MKPMNKMLSDYLKSIGSKGGTKRAKNLTAKRRKAIAKKAAKARWAKKDKKP